MRRTLHGDVISAARVLVGVPPERRRWVLERLFREAEHASRFVQQNARMHPIYGDGSLLAAALRRCPASEPWLDNADYCSCLVLVFEAHCSKSFQPRAQETQTGTVGSNSSRAKAISSPQS